MESRMIKIIIADEQRIYRESLMYVIENKGRIKVVGLAADDAETYEHCIESKPDMILIDIALPKNEGVDVTQRIKMEFPTIKILLLGKNSNDENVKNAVYYGADGFISKNIGVDELLLAIMCVAAGLNIFPRSFFCPAIFPHIVNSQPLTHQGRKIKIGDIDVYLTAKELTIIQMIVNGKNNKEIASSLFMAEGTIKNAITLLNSKLQLKDRTQLAVFALRNNLT
jgi:DNA-binding NarL/FixJ family response regulator